METQVGQHSIQGVGRQEALRKCPRGGHEAEGGHGTRGGSDDSFRGLMEDMCSLSDFKRPPSPEKKGDGDSDVGGRGVGLSRKLCSLCWQTDVADYRSTGEKSTGSTVTVFTAPESQKAPFK